MQELEITLGGENYTVTFQNGVVDEIQQNGINLTDTFTDEEFNEILEKNKLNYEKNSITRIN